MKRKGIWIGTSGWVYKEWAGHFYPRGWPKKDEFGYYARHFPTVEINATFYRLPSRAMVTGWREKSPAGFLFAVKGSRYLTHIRRLKDTGPGLRKYFSRLRGLGDRTGPILWQLPPNFSKSDENWDRLERFLAKLPSDYEHAVEFRHPSWFDEQTFRLLRRHRAANVWISSLRMPVDHAITGRSVYLRFHGLAGGAYHDYTEDELRPWAVQLAKAARKGLRCYVYFNNDLNTRAPNNAHALMRLVGKLAVAPLAAQAAVPRADIPFAKPKPETWPGWTTRGRTKQPDRVEPQRTRSRLARKLPRVRRRSARVNPPGSAGVRRFAAAGFSSSALPPKH